MLQSYKILAALLIVTLSSASWAQLSPTEAQKNLKPPGYQWDVTDGERWKNFGLVYAAQWGYYFLSQDEQVRSHGSFDNWTSNPFKPHFDKDHFDFNLTRHTLSGSAYYLFYRSQGYTYQSAFLWSVASSLVFEFTIKTVTEPPSFQDMYQTPVFGTIAGFGLEFVSDKFHRLDTWYGHGLGYLLNPFSILRTNGASATFSFTPHSYYVAAKWEF